MINSKEILALILALVILAFSNSFINTGKFINSLFIFAIILIIYVSVKKATAYYYEAEEETKIWSFQRYGLYERSYFKKPIPMIWFPLFLSLITKGLLWWLAILEFDVEARAERASRRHGLYRFTEVTEWHIAWIAVWGIIINALAAIIGYVLGFEFFAKLGIYYCIWSLIPLSSLDGSKIFFGKRILWIFMAVIGIILLWWGSTL